MCNPFKNVYELTPQNGYEEFWFLYEDQWGHFVNCCTFYYKGIKYQLIHDTCILYEKNGETQEFLLNNLKEAMEAPVLADGNCITEALKTIRPDDIGGI